MLRNNTNTKHPTMMEKGYIPIEENKKGYFTPDKKIEPNSNQHRMNPNSNDMSPEVVKARVFAEYFSMIDDLVIVADMKLRIISNNFSAKIIENVINKFNKHKKRINMHNLKADGGATNLDDCFNYSDVDQFRCNEQTVMNLIDIYTVLNYKLKKHIPEEMKRFKEAKIDRILRFIESLESGIKISKREEEQATHLRKISKLKSSMRAINIKKSNLTVRVSDLGMRVLHTGGVAATEGVFPHLE